MSSRHWEDADGSGRLPDSDGQEGTPAPGGNSEQTSDRTPAIPGPP